MRTGKTLALTRPVQFMAQERTIVDEAFSGDIIGVWDPGVLRIGDSLCEGPPVEFEGIPRFSPEHFVRVRLDDPLQAQAAEEGARAAVRGGGGAAVLRPPAHRARPHPGRGRRAAVRDHRAPPGQRIPGQGRLRPAALPLARWIEGDDLQLDKFELPGRQTCVLDVEGRPLVLFESEWLMRRAQEENPKIRFVAAVQPGRSSRSAA